MLKSEMVALILGSIFTIIGGYLLYKRRYLMKNGEKTKATVVRYVEVDVSTSDGGSVAYRPILHYVVNKNTDNEYTHALRYDKGSGFSSYEVGEVVEIIYNKKDFDEIIILGDNWSLILSITFFIAGLAVLGFLCFAPAWLRNIVFT